MQFAQLESCSLRYRLGGEPRGPWIVFANSLGTDLTIWDDVIERLPGGYGVLSYDKRGHGYSSVPTGPITIGDHARDLLQLCDHVGIETAILCGVSVGGMIAQSFAAQAPERTAGLILSNTGAKIGSPEIWNERIANIDTHGMAPAADGILERWFTEPFRTADSARLAGYRAMLTATPVAGYTATCAAIRDADLTAATSEIRAPTLCLAGDQDLATPPELVESLARLIEGADFRVIPNCGHIPAIEAPEVCADAIKEFLSSLATGSANGASLSSFEAGMDVRRKVLGDAHVNRATAQITNVDARFQRLITEGAWGRVWAGKHFSLRQRSIVTIALLAALDQDRELEMHLRAARNTGATQEDISEALLHVAIYAGVPKANHAFKLAKAVFAEASDGERDA